MHALFLASTLLVQQFDWPPSQQPPAQQLPSTGFQISINNGRVMVLGNDFKASADHLTVSGNSDQLVLNGNVELNSALRSLHLKMVDQVLIRLSDGTIMSGPPRPDVPSARLIACSGRSPKVETTTLPTDVSINNPSTASPPPQKDATLETPPENGQPTRVLAFWDSMVNMKSDPMRGGQPMPTLAGDLYIVGDDSQFISMPQGTVVVDLYDVNDGKSTPLERWVLDPETLRKSFVKNMLGWHYQLTLPWPNYQPEIKRVELKVQIVTSSHKPLAADPAFINLVRPNDPASQIRPGEPMGKR
jgi:hypothetical protein